MSRYDVVVVGGGLAGHCALLSAVETGASCLLLEKQESTGGSTVLSGGFLALAGTPEQRRAGVEDSPERLRDDLWEVSGREADPALLDAYVAEQEATAAWLREHGATFLSPVLSSGQSTARSHQTDPRALIDMLGQETRRVAEIRTSTQVLRLIRGTTGRVQGCVVRANDVEEEIFAEAVVLCTGGFVHNAKLVSIFAPSTEGSLNIGGAGNTGDGLLMAWALGADVRDMGWVKGTFGTHPGHTSADRHSILLTFYEGAVVVNQAGGRFVDESLSYKDIGVACLEQPERLGFQVFDQRIADASPRGVPLFDLKEALREGRLLHGDDLSEVAARAGVDGQELERTISRYNLAVDGSARDEVGRASLCFGAGELRPISSPPFYIYPSTTALLATYCGLRIDEQAQVINVWGDPIPGLYAAGEVTGGFHGKAYMTGSSLGKAAVFGRIAGRTAGGA